MALDKLSEVEQTALRRLVQNVGRAFYEPKHIVVLDQLVRHPVLKDDDLAGRLGLQLKELGKLMAPLVNHKLVSVFRQNEQKEGGLRAVGRSYFYLDYRHFCNVVKWRMSQMRRDIDSKLRNELNNKGYICPQCGRCYSPLESDQLMDWTDNTFRCNVCHAELVDNESAASVVGSQDRMQRFNAQMHWIREGLKKSESMVMPAFDITAFVRASFQDDKKKDGVKIASSDGKSRQDGFDVILDADKDEATVRKEREVEAAAKRQQNALPSWHLKSTISGDLTALGVAESIRAQPAVSSSNAAILQSLNSLQTTHNQRSQDPQVTIVSDVEDRKPVINKDADYYDQYYASLQSASLATTPTLADDDHNMRDVGMFFEQEEQKPSLAMLNGTLKGKRSRDHYEPDAHDTSFDRPTKLARPNLPGPGFSRHTSRTESSMSTGSSPLANGFAPSPPFREESQSLSLEPAPEQPVDDPMISVNGKLIPFSLITEDHHDQMTADEYTKYFEVFEERNM